MKVTRPKGWLPGERVVAVDPPLSPRVRERWSSRLHYYTGRTLTHTALNIEQAHRSTHLALLGRHLSPGVVAGLELAVEAAGEGGAALVLSPGLGIGAAGEDVSVTRPLRVAVDALPVVGREPTDESPPRGVGVVVLQPVVADGGGVADETDPCERDPAADAFEDWLLVDGCRIAWFPWPDRWAPRPARDARFRNRLAHLLFEREARGERPPWEAAGVPLALADVAESGRVAFVDRFAVVRQGGSALPRRWVVEGAGTPYLWQARLRQFSDHLGELLAGGATLPEALGRFRYLPPVGVLPPEALELATGQTDVLPSRYWVEAVPVPVEQLEVALDASAPLEPFDLFVPDRMKVFVPVPQALYEPRLLRREQVDPVFQETVDGYLAELNGVLGERAALRAMAPAVVGATDPEQIPAFPEPDPDGVPGEAPDPGAAVTDHAGRARQVVAGLHGRLADQGVLSAEELQGIDPAELDRGTFQGLGPFAALLEKKIAESDDRVDFGFLRLQTDIYRIRQLMLGAVEATRLATSPVLATIARGESRYATEQNLKTYFARATGGKPPPGGADPVDPAGGGGGPVFASRPAAELAGAPHSVLAGPRPPFAFSVEPRRLAAVEAAVAEAPAVAEAAPADAVIGKSPIVGEARLFRSATVAERIAEPPAPEAKSYAVATKAEVLSALATLPINLAGVEVALTANDTAVLSVKELQAWVDGQELGEAERAVLEARTRRSGEQVAVYLGPLTDAERKELGDQAGRFRRALNALLGANRRPLTGAALPGLVLSGLFDPDPTDGDEAAFLSVGVNALEVAAGALRRVEARIDDYRKALAACRKALGELEGIAGQWRDELAAREPRVLELRQDVTVARALLAEETARIQAVNERRRKILAEHVEFLFFARPRTASSRADLPAVRLHGEYRDPVPACLAGEVAAPDELREMVDVFREVPLAWLPHARLLVLDLDRLEVLQQVFVYAKRAATLRAEAPQAVAASEPAGPPAGPGKAVARLVGAYREAGRALTREKARMDLSQVGRGSWKEASARAREELSLSDLIEAGRGRSGLAQRAAAELERIESVAACLYGRCREVLPAVRLEWAGRLGPFDRPADLRTLDGLPGFATVDPELRRDLQRLTDWLFSRVDPSVPEALALANDLVRVCLLLASHAPVSAIVEGHLPQPVAGQVGDVIDLVLDRGPVRVGMQMALYSGLQIAAQGVVEDLTPQAARIRITHSAEPTFRIEAGAKGKAI